MNGLRYVAIVLIAAAACAPARAGVSKYDFMPREIRACFGDAERLCRHAYPNATKLIACLRRNEASLQRHCRTVFERGLRRRGLPT